MIDCLGELALSHLKESLLGAHLKGALGSHEVIGVVLGSGGLWVEGRRNIRTAS